jgi:phosphoketolase
MRYSLDRLEQLHAPFGAANYLGAARLYLRDNVLLQEPLRPDHIEPPLPGHWERHCAYIRAQDEDLPEVTSWRWTGPAVVARSSAGGE